MSHPHDPFVPLRMLTATETERLGRNLDDALSLCRKFRLGTSDIRSTPELSGLVAMRVSRRISVEAITAGMARLSLDEGRAHVEVPAEALEPFSGPLLKRLRPVVRELNRRNCEAHNSHEALVEKATRRLSRARDEHRDAQRLMAHAQNRLAASSAALQRASDELAHLTMEDKTA